MILPLVYYQLVILVLLWLCVMLPYLWPTLPSGMPKRPAAQTPPRPPCREWVMKMTGFSRVKIVKPLNPVGLITHG